MIDLYAALGLTAKATAAEIKSAYRKAVKSAHPDVGGDATKFAEIQQAYDVLMDDAAREHYDRTGEIAHGPMEGSEEGEIRNYITQLMMQALQQLQDVERQDVIEMMKQILSVSRQQVDTQRKLQAKQTNKLKAALARIKVKKGKADSLSGLLAWQIGESDRLVAKADHTLSLMEKVRALVDDHTYSTAVTREARGGLKPGGLWMYGGGQTA